MIRHIILLFCLLVLISCDEEVPVDPYAVSAFTRDSIYLKGEELFSNKKYTEAEKLLNTIRARDIYDVKYYSLNYRIKEGLGKYSEAIHYLNLSLRGSQQKAPIYFLLSHAFASINMMDSSIVCLSRAIAIDSTNPGYLKWRMQYYLKNNLVALALDDVNRMLAIDSNKLEYQCYVALCKYQSGDTIGAIQSYQTVLKKKGSNLNALKSLGFIYLNLGQFRKAKPLFAKYIDIQPTNGEVFFGMSEIMANENNADLACDYLLKSIEYGYQDAYNYAYKYKTQLEKRGIQIKSQSDIPSDPTDEPSRHI